MFDGAFLLQNASYRPDCYINVGESNTAHLKGRYRQHPLCLIWNEMTFLYNFTFSFYYSPHGPPPSYNGTLWKNVMQLRAAAPNVTLFDSALFKTLQFYTPSDGTEDEMWVTFDSTIQRYHFLSTGYSTKQLK